MFEYDDEIQEAVRALIWTDEYVERQRRQSAKFAGASETSAALPTVTSASTAAPTTTTAAADESAAPAPSTTAAPAGSNDIAMNG